MEERVTGAAVADAGAQSLEAATDVLEMAELVNTMSPFRVKNPVPEDLGLHPIMQEVIASNIPDDGTLIAVRSPAQGSEYASPFFSQKPVIAKHTEYKLPLGVRRVSTKTGEDLGHVVSDLDPAFGLDENGNLLPEQAFHNPQKTDSFGAQVNKMLGYDAVQHPDHINGVTLYSDDVSFEQLLDETIVMDDNGYVSHGTMIETFAKHSSNPESTIAAILEKSPPDIALKITDLLGK